jgi:ubiquinone/menaquinone biosynthesis C-methylase UbiE
MQLNDYSDKAKLYGKGGITGTGYLAYRDILKFIPDHLRKFNALDFGCGNGRATRLLKNHNFNVIGVDISAPMLLEARKIDHDTPYVLINDKIPFSDQNFHIVISTLVLFEIPTIEKMISVLSEVSRVLHKDGVAILVTGSEVMYSHEWLSIFPLVQKTAFSSGELIKIKLSNGLILSDYYWTDHDYQYVFKKSKLKCVLTHFPLGMENEYPWISEYTHSPYVLYVLEKSQ